MDFTPAARIAPAARGRTATAPLTGAVRRTGTNRSAPRRRPPARVLSGALVLVAVGILVTTLTMETNGATSLPVAIASADAGVSSARSGNRVVAGPIAGPTFFFDDAADALTERAADRAGAASALGRTVAQATRAPSESAAPTPSRGTDTFVADALASVARDRVSLPATPPVMGLVPHGAPTVELGADPITDGEIASPALRALASPPGRTVAPTGSTEIEVVVGPGDTLSGILNDHGVRIEQMPAVLADEVVGRHLSRLDVGQKFTIVRNVDGDFHSLAGRVGNDTRVSLRRASDGFAAAAIDLPIEKERVVTSGTIEQSLYLAAEQANLKQSTIMTLADIFQWELDFARDIRKGDHFAIVYDRLYREGKYIGDGDILAAEFERGGRTHRAIRFVAEDGTAGYYAPDGTSKRRTFTRHPVDVVRITSKFDPNRLHPVLHQIRAHRGVDYGAPHGSPIRATADGIVRFSGTKNAYGNTVILQHGKRVKTLYAHMSRISDKSIVGKRVRQGDVIGYVGNTGRVTGTHLHYEFRVNDEHVDPLTVELPAAAPIAPEHRDALHAVADELVGQMRSVLPGAATAVASNDVPSSLDAVSALGGGAGGDTGTIVALER